MTTFHTNNPLGSTAVKDLYDNAENLDVAVNDQEHDTWVDRFGKVRPTLSGQERSFDSFMDTSGSQFAGFMDASSEAFQQFLLSSGYHDLGDYGPGLEITERNQIFWRDGELYRASADLSLPYTTTGDWGTEGGSFVSVGDAALRQQLAQPGGGEMVAFQQAGTGAVTRTTQDKMRDMVSVRDFGALGIGGDDTVAIQKAINSGRPIYFPNGVYGVDGMKGAVPEFDNTRKGGILITDHTCIIGESKEGVVLLNISDNWRSVISLKGGKGVEIRNCTVDGGFPSRIPVPLAQDSIRGEGIIGWGGGTLEDFVLDNVHIQNTGHYGLGLQSIAVNRATISRITGTNIGGDLIDIKDFPASPKVGITISDGEVRRFGVNATAANGSENAAGFDLRGDVLASNLRVVDLYVEVDPAEGAPYICGIRVNANVNSDNGRLGGRKARVIGASVKSRKLDSEGSQTSQRIYGYHLGDQYCSIVGAVAENCYVGFMVATSGDSQPIGNSLVGITAINCKGADGQGAGLRLNTGADNTFAQINAIGCDVGFSANSVGNFVTVIGENNGQDHNLSGSVLRRGRYEFINSSGNASHLSDDVTVWSAQNPRLRFRSTHDGTWPTPDPLAGGIDWVVADSTGYGPGVRAQVNARHTGASGASTNIVMSVRAASGMVDVLLVNEAGVILPLASTPYSNDAAAAAGGIPVNGIYRRPDGLLALRVS